MKMLRKGISPLIATVLIIGFTVALAAIIMTWGTKFAGTMQENVGTTTEENMVCTNDVKFEVVSACVTGNDIKVTVKNDANKRIEKFGATFYESESKIFAPTDETKFPLLGGFGVYNPSPSVTVTPALTAANVKYVELMPVVNVGAKNITCPIKKGFGDKNFVEPLGAC